MSALITSGVVRIRVSAVIQAIGCSRVLLVLVAIGETVILLTLSLHLYRNTYYREKGAQQNDRSLADGAGSGANAVG